MNRVTVLNTLGLVAALAAAVLAARRPDRVAAVEQMGGPVPSPRRVPLPEGGFALADATGHLVPLRPYKRIVSTSTMGDRLLHELCEPARIVAFSVVGARSSPWAHQLSDKPSVDGIGSLEAVIALRPDLVLLNSFGVAARVAKLRAAGIEVFDLGEMRGLRSLLPAAETIGELVGHPERGVHFARSFARRMRNVAAGLGSRPRRRAVYVAVIGTKLYGGTVGTSYHDVLTAAGLHDAAAERFSDWPAYSAEHLVMLAPELVVTKAGMADAVCSYPGLEGLPACTGATGATIELPAALIDEPGPAMLDAAELLYDKVYGGNPGN